MINLLPPETKQSYRYALRNVVLARWLLAFALAFIGLGALGTGGVVYMQQLSHQYARQTDIIQEQLKQQKLTETQSHIQDMTNDFRLVVQVLSQEVLFSKLLEQIAATIPPNANLTNLNITQAAGGIDLTAVATDYTTATQVQVNLADPSNKIFSKADILNITCSSTAANPRYPCTVTIRALFSDNNPFLFINSSGKKTP